MASMTTGFTHRRVPSPAGRMHLVEQGNLTVSSPPRKAAEAALAPSGSAWGTTPAPPARSPPASRRVAPVSPTHPTRRASNGP
ncbi:hypothetical protein P3T27_001995 [Kitasatospora sp. MAA19]|nr:hypothetical protein [Kitasatospora sp. MAA19]